MANDFISRQAAIDAINKALDRETLLNSFVRKIAVDAVKVLPSAEPEQKWIPCTERLPEEQKKSYWVCTDSGYQYECRWTNINHIWTQFTTDWHWHLMDIPQYEKIIAWMPLPEPYTERGE